ncbi:E3 ubiquitin-protein ligase synoviolin B [Hydra vulgaris]|uniref:E3 ubiquitin-protein ligase synoviolin B n=1 Tax=Hydra vulgaris TaxID=6087 RepID=UPI001F5F9957|nr:E3 ubiquitin-protein ligase synoviolin B [Hydra vulgaris]
MVKFKMKFALVTVGTSLATAAVITNAFVQKKQFYPSVVFLTKSNSSLAVLYAQVFVLLFLIGKALRRIFFGQLRAAEVEHLIEKFWYVITETCLAFTVFRDDFSPKFVALFTFLLFMKAFHWLMEDRVDYMDRTPVISFLFHLRVISLMMLLGTLDSVLIHHAFRITLSSGASVQMVFGFEYAILLTMVIATAMKYMLHSIDSYFEHPWESRNVYLLYSELITGFVKCCLYVSFVGLMVKIHTFPLFAIRPMYLTIRNFKKSLSDVILSRRAITYMNTRFPDATEEELLRLENTCIICREQMLIGKKLPCNHIFHTYCLRSWFQRQQSCPTCRMDVLSQAAQMARPSSVPQFSPPPPQPQPAPQSSPLFGMSQAQSFSPPSMAPPVVNTTSMPSASSTTTSTTTGLFSFPPTFTFPPPPGFMSDTSFFNPNINRTSSFASMNLGMAGSLPFPPFPMFSPPNINFGQLTDEQLKSMEGQERANVEARLRILRNVHTLLDTAILQLNQYSQVINNLNLLNQSNNIQSFLNQQSTASPTSLSPSNVQNTSNEVRTLGSNSSLFTNTKSATFSTQIVTPVKDTISNCETSAGSSTDMELRRRRLERFESLTKEQKKDTDNV